jgi:hypothetical protein
MLKFLRCGVDGPSFKPQAEGPPFVGCPGVLIQYIRGHPLHLETVSSIRYEVDKYNGGGRGRNDSFDTFAYRFILLIQESASR